jgi:hypothetical protein
MRTEENTVQALPGRERGEPQPRMSQLDRTLHSTVLRLLKGILNTYEGWIKAHS